MPETVAARRAREVVAELEALNPTPEPELEPVEELVTELVERVARLERATEKMRPDVTK